jgi:hypothetical protein
MECVAHCAEYQMPLSMVGLSAAVGTAMSAVTSLTYGDLSGRRS